MKIKRIRKIPLLTIAVFRTVIILTAILPTATMLTSCADLSGIIADIPPPTPTDMPPFVITKPVFEITERPFYFRYAGIVFNLLNHSENIIEKITVSFMLFDARTQESPFIGSNKFEISKWDLVLPNENKEIIISLDRFIYIAPTEAYLIDFFFITEILYVDGSIWQDKYGMFRVRD